MLETPEDVTELENLGFSDTGKVKLGNAEDLELVEVLSPEVSRDGNYHSNAGLRKAIYDPDAKLAVVQEHHAVFPF